MLHIYYTFYTHYAYHTHITLITYYITHIFTQTLHRHYFFHKYYTNITQLVYNFYTDSTNILFCNELKEFDSGCLVHPKKLQVEDKADSAQTILVSLPD